jgi:mono/diheme cytochrome c family protein
MLAGCLIFACLLMPGESSQIKDDYMSSLTGNPLKGRNVFVSKGCIECHSAWGVGGKTGPDLARLGMGRSHLQIAGALWNHSPEMIESMRQRGVWRPTLTTEEVSDFISYLYYIDYYNETGSPTGGQRLFEEKGCAACHSIKGSGGSAGPPLDDYRRYRNTLFVAQSMWNHGPQMVAAMEANGIEKPYLEGKQAVSLLAFIRGQTTGEIPDDKFMLPGSPSAGRRLFAEKGCAACHSTDGVHGTNGPDLWKTGSYKSAVEIAGAMWNHSGEIWAEMRQAGMARPAFGGNEMADIVSYIYFLRYVDRPGDVATGKRLFTSKGCAECHSPVSTLSASPALASPPNLMAAMWNHAPVMETMAVRKGMAWPEFHDDEMRDLVEYLKTSAISPKQGSK